MLGVRVCEYDLNAHYCCNLPNSDQTFLHDNRFRSSQISHELQKQRFLQTAQVRRQRQQRLRVDLHDHLRSNHSPRHSHHLFHHHRKLLTALLSPRKSRRIRKIRGWSTQRCNRKVKLRLSRCFKKPIECEAAG